MSQYYVGIDLHKSVAQICVLDAEGEIERERRWKIPDREAGDELIGFLAQWREGGRFAVEAVGCNRWFVLGCRDAGLEVVVAHAAALGLKKKGRKTDKHDAREIARRLRLGDIDREALSHFPTEREYKLRSLLRVRHAQVQRRQQTVNQIRAKLNAYLIRPDVANLNTNKGVAWLRQVEMPSEELDLAISVLTDDLESLRGQIKRLDARITKMEEDADVEALMHLPQAGVQTAATVLYELGNLERFRRIREVAAYAGVVPRVSQSGVGKAHHGSITKRGNSELRWILTQWAIRLLRNNSVVRRWAEKQRIRRHTNKLRMALARRLVIGVYVMLTRGEVFSLERCLGLEAA